MSLSLILLGGFAIEADRAPLAVTSRKARALLAALALARHRTMSRARLAGLLWGSSDAEQARDSLRQAIAHLRRVGVEIVTPDADSIALPGSVAVDVDAFVAALARGDAAEALRHYRGDLLEGQTFRDPAIQGWLEAERTRLRALAIDAFAAELDRVGDRPEAAELAHRLLALDPLQERAHRALMRLATARGDTSAALARFVALRDLLRRELDTAPEAETTALAQAVRTGRARELPPAVTEAARSRAADVHVRQVTVLAALAADQTPDDGWTALLADAVGAAGGDVALQHEGQLIAVWGLERTREGDAASAAGVAQSVLGLIGGAASIGVVEGALLVDGTATPPPRAGHLALRLAARAEPGTLAIEPGLAERLRRPLRPTPPLVGREAELGQILGAARAALSAGRGLVIHLGGEAGIGKTRLAREAAEALQAEGVAAALVGFDWFSNATHPGQRIAAALPPASGLEVGDAFDEAVLAALEGRGLTAGDRLRLEALVPEERLRRDLRMTDALIAAAAGARGLLLVIEDCHWASEAAASFLLELADAAARLPVVMLLTERPGETSLGPRLAARGRAPLVRLTLAPLAPAAAEALARAAGADARRVELATARAGGHPLFLLRLLESDPADDRVPSTIGALVQEQVERLPSPERTALRQASVLGRQFAPTDFRAIFGGPPPVPTGDLLVADGALHAFGHDLIHRAVYESVPEDLRRQLHARAAAHYRASDSLRWADHALLSDDDAEASRAAAAAANAMIAARRFRAALPYVERGLARGGDPEAVAELHCSHATVLRIRGDMTGALESYRAAFSHAIHPSTRAATLSQTALVLYRLDRRAEAERALDDAEAIADRAGLGGVVRAEIHERRGNLAFNAGDHEACARHHATALAHVEPTGDLRAIARAHGGLGDAAYAAGRMRTATAHFQRAIALAREGGFGMVVEEFGYVHAHAHHYAEPGPHAAALADLAVEGAVASGASRSEAIARIVRCHGRLAGLDLDGATDDFEQITRLLPDSREARLIDHAETIRAMLAYRRGDLDAARALVRPGVQAGHLAPRTAGLRLGILALVGEASERRRAIEIGTAARHGWLAQGVLWFHRLALEGAIRHGEVDLARAQAAALRAFTAEEPLRWVDLAIENAELHLSPDPVRARAFAARAEAAGIRDLPPLDTATTAPSEGQVA